MFNKYFILILLLLPNESFESTNELCFIQDNTECNGKYEYKCRQDLCATSQKVCDRYLSINLFAQATFRYSMLHHNEIVKIKQITQNIRNCSVVAATRRQPQALLPLTLTATSPAPLPPQPQVPIAFNTETAICIKDIKKCRHAPQNREIMIPPVIKKRMCRCQKGKFAFECEQEFCALSSQHCDDFIARVNENFKVKPLKPFKVATCWLWLSEFMCLYVLWCVV